MLISFKSNNKIALKLEDLMEVTDSEPETVRTGRELTVVQEQGLFQHDTGDTYNGFCEAKKKDRSIKMNGAGTYTTAEGDTYNGIWEADKLGANEKVTITYSEGSKYEGTFKDWSYNGPGRYQYPDDSVLEGEFIDNTPVGNLTLIDPNEHMWLGKAEQGYGWFEPINHYYNMLERTSATKPKKARKTKDVES